MPFYLSDGTTKQVETMNQTDGFNCFANDLFQAVELPYGNDRFSMVLLLPSETNTVSDIIEQLTTENWNSWMQGFWQMETSIFLPKFKYACDMTLNSVLMSMGMNVAFTENADFSGISSTNMMISEVKHKTYIDVSEEGTEAAAVTSIGMVGTAMPSTIEFNKPFLFAVREVQSGSVVFLGVVTEPSYE